MGHNESSPKREIYNNIKETSQINNLALYLKELGG